MHKKIYRLLLIFLLTIDLSAVFFGAYHTLVKQIPSEIKILVGEEEEFDFSVPVVARLFANERDVFCVNNREVITNNVDINLNKPFVILSEKTGKYSIDLTLFGFIKYKKITLDVIDTVELMPGGEPIGIYVKTNGVMVLGTSTITSIDGMSYEPAVNKVKAGDYITEVNHTIIHDKNELIDYIQNSEGKSVILTIRRDLEMMDVSITPIETAIGEYKIGTWIRDDTQGIGTLTFVTKDHQFGALGHGITDIDTSLLLEVNDGEVYSAEIMSIVKGKNGCPGELIGLINQSDKCKVGTIEKNTNQGIFGDVSDQSSCVSTKDTLPIGLKQDINLGFAEIRCNVNGSIEDYSIEIEKIDRSNSHLSKGLVIKITDERLLAMTGGIVQGMSGSPIIQDGKIVGAVTHVFIQDSTKGYGTFIENMIRNLDFATEKISQ